MTLPQEIHEEWALESERRTNHVNVKGCAPLHKVGASASVRIDPDRVTVTFQRERHADDGSGWTKWVFNRLCISGERINLGRGGARGRMSYEWYDAEALRALPAWALDIVNRAQPRERA